MSQKDGIVHLQDLPENKVSIKLPNSIQKSMIDTALKISNINELSRILSISKTTVYDFRNSRQESIIFSTVKKISSLLVNNSHKEFSLENLETKIELIRAKSNGNPVYYPKFPINFNTKEGFEIISSILFDDGIARSTLRPFYTNNEESLVNRFVSNVNIVVGEIIPYKRLDKRTDTYQVELPKILGYILVDGLDLIPGRKVLNNPSISEFILNGNEIFQKAFLQQTFDDERSSVCYRKCIEFSQYRTENKPPLRLIQLKGIIERLGIRTNKISFVEVRKTKKGYLSYGWILTITNQVDIKIFKEKINFSLERKKKKLENLLNSYTSKPMVKRFTATEEALKICEKLKSENKSITIYNVSKESNKSRRYTARLMIKMLKENKLQIVKPKTMLRTGGSKPKEFKIATMVV